ncbi:MAG: hypothetical protein QG567_2244 [Campylobacterota bacterium]|nr:hypothetical protein [Campylobacterota bacterium]
MVSVKGWVVMKRDDFAREIDIDQELNVDFESLNGNRDWLEVYALYQENIEIFSEIIEQTMHRYDMTKIQARDAVLYELMSANYERYHRESLHSRNRVKWSFVYIATFSGLFLSGLLSLFVIQRKLKFNLLFEEMFAKDGWNKRFYRYITQILSNKTISKAILYTHPGIAKDIFNKSIEQWDGNVINRRYSSLLFGFKESFLMISKNLFFIHRLFKLSKNLNIIYIYLRIIRKHLLYSSQIKNIEADVMVAAGDYYWNPIKYFVYKKNVKNIILLQHNFKNEYLHNRLFQYCDFYYAHSKQAIEKLEGIPFTKKYAIGSFQLLPYLKDVPIEYDIMFINQTVNDNLTNVYPDLDQEQLIVSYYILIDNFKQYMQQHPNLKAIYVAKGETIDSEPSITVKKMFQNIPNVTFEGAYGPKTFEVVKKSALIINMYSSVGFEAYGFDKKVLWINYNGCCDVFKYDTEEESLHVLKDSTDYNTFANRVDLLLSPDVTVIDYYKKLKEKYMNIQENPAKIVADKIYALLAVSSC